VSWVLADELAHSVAKECHDLVWRTLTAPYRDVRATAALFAKIDVPQTSRVTPLRGDPEELLRSSFASPIALEDVRGQMDVFSVLEKENTRRRVIGWPRRWNARAHDGNLDVLTKIWHVGGSDGLQCVKHLGAVFTTPAAIDAGVALFASELDEKLSTLRAVVASPLSCQTKWQMFRSVAGAVRWRFFATHPRISSPLAATADDAIANAVDTPALPAATPSVKSRTLQLTSLASGGLGLTSLDAEGPALYAACSAISPWPPAPVEVSDDGFVPRCRSIREVSRELEAIKDATLTRVFDPNFAARQDTNTPWHLISRTTKHNVIDDDTWRHFRTVYMYYDFTYPPCRAPQPPRTAFDHSHSCLLCAPRTVSPGTSV
jgi:hypothetical protein